MAVIKESKRDSDSRLVKFPPGEPVFDGRPFDESIFAEVDSLLAQEYCSDGWLEIETPDSRLVCLIHRYKPFLAGLVERKAFTLVPLREIPVRAKQIGGEGICGLFHADPLRVLMMAVHFRHKPELQAATNLVDLLHVLDVLAHEGHNAALALERAGKRTLLFLQKGIPTRLYFGDHLEDPDDGDVTQKFLKYGFAPDAPVGRVEVFNRLVIEPDPDAGKPLAELNRQAKPPPPVSIQVHKGGVLVLQRLFMPPFMLIGRESGCGLHLDDLGISRRHAKLAWDRGRFVIEDLGSTNGTQVNGKSIERWELTAQDRIDVGKFWLRLVEPMAVQAAQKTQMMSSKEGADKLYLVGANQSVTVPVANEITIGKAEGVDVRTRGFFVRPIHARLKNTGDGTAVLTCVGKARVQRNGKKLQSVSLNPGDKVTIGNVRFQLVSVPTFEQIDG